MPGFSLAGGSAAPMVMRYVMRVYSDSFMPADEMPRQKKDASKSVSCDSIASQRDMSAFTTSRSFACRAPVALRPTVCTSVTSGSSRHSRSTPCPTMPVAPNSSTFTIPPQSHARLRLSRRRVMESDYRRRGIWVVVLVTVLLAVSVGYFAYNAGVAHGVMTGQQIAAAGAGGTTPAVPPAALYWYGYGWHRPWGFGFFPFLFLMFFFIWALRAL